MDLAASSDPWPACEGVPFCRLLVSDVYGRCADSITSGGRREARSTKDRSGRLTAFCGHINGRVTLIHWRTLVTTLAVGLLVVFAALDGAVHWSSSASMPF